MRGSGGSWVVAQNNSLPLLWLGKTVSQQWVSILFRCKKQSQACSFWVWSYLKTLPSLYCVGMGWLWRTLFWQSSASRMGALIFAYPAAHFVSFTSQLFFILWSERDSASSFILLVGFRPRRMYDHWAMIIQNQNQSQRHLFFHLLLLSNRFPTWTWTWPEREREEKGDTRNIRTETEIAQQGGR